MKVSLASSTPGSPPPGEAEAAVRRRLAADAYRPEVIRLLLVAEAPPRALDRYFYFPDVTTHDALYRYVITGLYGVTPDRASKPEWLSRLAKDGVFLIDLTEEPEGVQSLPAAVPELIERCAELNPEAIILLKATVYDAAFQPLKQVGMPVVDVRVPFPGSGQQGRFLERFALALQLADVEIPERKTS